MADYLGIAAVHSYELGHRDALIISFGRMQRYHDSVNIKKMVEELVNVYDFNKKNFKRIFKLWYVIYKLVLESNEIPRFSSACHKLNIIIHSAIENQGALKYIIKELGKLASKLRNSSQLLNIFDELKCRPKIKQKVRWFSQLYVLLWAQRAYKKNAFTENECPVRIEVIESY